ncbi:MAG: SCO family protein [Proteobacteria bacterium]|nr:SCO family protein [Pseudomonadota bacterium]
MVIRFPFGSEGRVIYKYAIIAGLSFPLLILGGALVLSRFSAPTPAMHFQLANQFGQRVSEKNFAGRYQMVFFGYTGCSSLCPATLTQLGSVQRVLRQKKKEVGILFITTDLVHDTPAALKQYLSHFDASIIGLTGTKMELAALYKDFSVYAGQFGKSRLSDHSGFIYLTNPAGRVVAHFTVQLPVPEMAQRVSAMINPPVERKKVT